MTPLPSPEESLRSSINKYGIPLKGRDFVHIITDRDAQIIARLEEELKFVRCGTCGVFKIHHEAYPVPCVDLHEWALAEAAYLRVIEELRGTK